MALHQSIKETFHHLEDNPHDEQHRKKAEDAFNKHPDAVFSVIKEEANKHPSGQPAGSAHPQPTADPDWVNSVGEQRCTPLKKVKPQSL